MAIDAFGLKSASSRFPSVHGADLEGHVWTAPVVKGLVEALRTLRVRSCLRPVGAGTNVPLALMLVRMALRPISKTRSL